MKAMDENVKEWLRPILPTGSTATRRFPCSFTSQRAFVCRKIRTSRLLWLDPVPGLLPFEHTCRREKQSVPRGRTGCFLGSNDQDVIIFTRMNLSLSRRKGFSRGCTRLFPATKPIKCTCSSVCWRTPKKYMPGCRREPISMCAVTRPEWQRTSTSRFIRSSQKRADYLLKPLPHMSKRSGKKNVTNGTFTRSTGVQEYRSRISLVGSK